MEIINNQKINEKPVKQVKVLPRKIFVISCISILFLTFISSILLYLRYSLQVNNRLLDALTNLFYMDKENNIPTYISTILLLMASLVLLYIFINKSIKKDRYQYYWAILSGIFLLMSMDEFMGIHERMIEPLRASLNLGGWFYFAWIIPAFLLVCVVGLFFLRFILSLKFPIRKMFIISGVIYIGGALGVESLGGYITDNYGQRNFLFAMVANLEETLELVGVAYFIYALLTYIKNYQEQTIKINILKSIPERFSQERLASVNREQKESFAKAPAKMEQTFRPSHFTIKEALNTKDRTAFPISEKKRSSSKKNKE